MELRIKDRLLLPLLLPKEGTFQQFNLKKGILSKIELSEQERSEVNLRENSQTGSIEWDVEKDTPLAADFNAEELAYLKAACEKLSEESLSDEMWTVVTKVYDSIPKDQ